MQPSTRDRVTTVSVELKKKSVIFWFSRPDESKIDNFIEISWKRAPRKGSLNSSFFYLQQPVTPAISCCIRVPSVAARTAWRGKPSLLACLAVTVLSSFYQGVAAGGCSPGREADRESCTFN